MRFAGSELLFIIGIFAIEIEFVIVVLSGINIIYGLVIALAIGVMLMGFFFAQQIKNLKDISGHLGLSMHLYYSQNEKTSADLLIEEYKIIPITEEDLIEYEESDEYLNSFDKFVTDTNFTFPPEIKSKEEKFLYLEMQKRFTSNFITELMENHKNDKTENKESISSVFKKCLRRFIINKVDLINTYPAITKEQLIIQEKNESKSPKNQKNTEDNDNLIQTKTNEVNEFISSYKILKYALVIIFIISMSTIFISWTNQTIVFYLNIISIIIFSIWIYLQFKEYKDFKKNVEKLFELSILVNENPEIDVKNLIRKAPYCSYTLVKVKKDNSVDFVEMLLIATRPFIDAFKFSQNWFFYNSYYYFALSSLAVLEYAGDISEDIPIFYVKFASGYVTFDEQTFNVRNVIENAKTRTYFKLMKEAQNSNELLKDELISSKSSREGWKARSNLNTARYNTERENLEKYLQDQENKPKLKFEMSKEYNILPIILLILIIILGIKTFF